MFYSRRCGWRRRSLEPHLDRKMLLTMGCFHCGLVFCRMKRAWNCTLPCYASYRKTSCTSWVCQRGTRKRFGTLSTVSTTRTLCECLGPCPFMDGICSRCSDLRSRDVERLAVGISNESDLCRRRGLHILQRVLAWAGESGNVGGNGCDTEPSSPQIPQSSGPTRGTPRTKAIFSR